MASRGMQLVEGGLLMEIGSVVCLNGEFVPAREAAVPVDDRGVLYGMGIFETIRVSGGIPALTDLHLSRLFASARELGLEVPFGQPEISRMILRTAKENGMDRGGLRLTLTAGGISARPCVFITARKTPYRPDQYRDGIRAGFSSIKRNRHSPLVRHKTLNYFENMLARGEAAAHGWGEAFLLNNSGSLAEGSVSNIFLVGKGVVVTPDLQSGLLPGITRQRVIEFCSGVRLRVEERPVMPDELSRAGECFITNSLMGVMPVVQVGGAVIGNGRPGEITGIIMDALGTEPEGL